jgi:hypothetical protein
MLTLNGPLTITLPTEWNHVINRPKPPLQTRIMLIGEFGHWMGTGFWNGTQWEDVDGNRLNPGYWAELPDMYDMLCKLQGID